MSLQTPLIIGIDPGTTTGMAFLDLKGNLVLTRSGRNLSRSDVSKIIADAGRPLIIAVDINPVPKRVEKLAAAFSAKLMWPEESLQKADKNKLIEEYQLQANRHEKDALSAAVYAYKRIRPVTNKIEQELRAKHIPDFEKYLDSIAQDVLIGKSTIASSLAKRRQAD
ncbi:MAG: DUF460 domain-containing protein [Candidatus Aenigmarchaeota archaeon]|nr:DUF460 domain-containing protein [Candidatus Aenigmarchaeota archaeon]